VVEHALVQRTDMCGGQRSSRVFIEPTVKLRMERTVTKKNRLVVVALLTLGSTLAVQTSAAQDPVTVVVTGITTSALLDKLSEKANNIVQNAGAVGSLLASKAARDIQLEIMAARIQLHDELNQNWDRLDAQKVSVLKEIDSSLTPVEKDIGRVSQMQDDLVLDVDSTLNRIPFLKDVKTIRRIWGASQYYRPNGIYLVTLHGNIFDAGAGAPDVYIGGRHLSTPPSVRPPYDVTLEIPANLLNDRFQDRKITQIPVTVKQRVAARDYSFQVWREEYKTQDFNFTIELFPKYPAAYRLTEYDDQPSFDEAQTSTWPRRETLIPGCGNSGCNAYYTICEDVPPGSEPIAAVNLYDSRGVGWYSGFGQCTVKSTGVCCQYWQHSHDQARNVGFDVQYHPATTTTVARDIDLVPISGDALSHYFDDPQANDSGAAKDKNVGTGTSAAQQPYTIVEKGIDHGAVRIGQTYDIHFSNAMKSFTLVFRTFTGQEIVLTPGKGSDLLETSQLENTTSFKRITVALKAPW
jgi:hypothetical protein